MIWKKVLCSWLRSTLENPKQTAVLAWVTFGCRGYIGQFLQNADEPLQFISGSVRALLGASSFVPAWLGSDYVQR